LGSGQLIGIIISILTIRRNVSLLLILMIFS
jgi:hypothetical protein